MRFRVTLLVVAAGLSGCVVGLPSQFSVPSEAPPEVRKNIRLLYWDAQCRAQGCVNIQVLAIRGTNCSAAIPWLIVLLADDTYA